MESEEESAELERPLIVELGAGDFRSGVFCRMFGLEERGVSGGTADGSRECTSMEYSLRARSLQPIRGEDQHELQQDRVWRLTKASFAPLPFSFRLVPIGSPPPAHLPRSLARSSQLADAHTPHSASGSPASMQRVRAGTIREPTRSSLIWLRVVCARGRAP